MANLYPPPLNQRWKSGTFWLLRGFILGPFAVPVILSKIVGTLETKSLNNIDGTVSMGFSYTVSQITVENSVNPRCMEQKGKACQIKLSSFFYCGKEA